MEFNRLPKFRYYNGMTAITVIMKDDLPLARGLAVCSYKDDFNLQKGDGLSYGRALKACEKEMSLESVVEKMHETRNEILKAQYSYLLYSGYKYFSEYRPTLTPSELAILGKIAYVLITPDISKKEK